MAEGTTVQSLPPLETLEDDAVLYVAQNDQDYHVTAGQLKELLVKNLPPAPLPEGLVTNEELDQALQEVPQNVLASEGFAQVVTDLNQADQDAVTRLDGLDQEVVKKLNAPAEAVQGALLAFRDEALVQVAQDLGNVAYVNGFSQGTTPDGSVFNPFKTIQAALDMIAAKESSTWAVLVSPGAYPEVIVPEADNLIVQGFGTVGAQLVRISGLYIYGNTTRFRLKDVTIMGTDPAQIPLFIEGGPQRHYFNNVAVVPAAGSTQPTVKIAGETSNWTVFLDCDIQGEVELSGTPTNTAVYFNSMADASMHVNIQSAYNVFVHDTIRLSGITHAAGNLYMTRVTGFGAIGLNSTETANDLIIEFSSMRKKDGTFAPLALANGGLRIQDQFVSDAG